MKRSPLRRIGRRRAGLAKDWELCKRAVNERENGACQLCYATLGSYGLPTYVLPGESGGIEKRFCSGPLDFHHVTPRSKAPRLVCDPDNVVLIHRSFHTFIHDNPRWARENGWLK